MTIRYCNLRKKKSTYFGIIEKENPGAGKGRHANRARGRWWLEQRNDLVKIFAKFATYRSVVPKSSVHVVALSTNC